MAEDARPIALERNLRTPVALCGRLFAIVLPRHTATDPLSRMGKTFAKITTTFSRIEMNLCSTVVPRRV
jgi:hypothetical protein